MYVETDISIELSIDKHFESSFIRLEMMYLY